MLLSILKLKKKKRCNLLKNLFRVLKNVLKKNPDDKTLSKKMWLGLQLQKLFIALLRCVTKTV